jgi:bifunctional non-homologous end joining protein LigD
MGLKQYESKREFEKTPEPKPVLRHEGGQLIFVVHKHAARALHYDLRLELEGVLKSWAVPRGPSLNPALKRLAVMVEDHPLGSGFWGVIPRQLQRRQHYRLGPGLISTRPPEIERK